jgi:glucosyl-dolichyl phosphate glucuronosyltransferase
VEKKTPLVSIVICTFNRANILLDALMSVFEQELEESKYEVIVVDNNSSDNTKEIINEYKDKYNTLNYVIELNQGLSNARNRGWKEAKGIYTAYIDDDCKLPDNWLLNAEKLINKYTPGVFGGPIYPYYKDPIPKWFKDSHGAYLPFNKITKLSGNNVVRIYGGNMFWRRDILSKLGGFNTNFGMIGTKPAFAEESVLLKKLADEMPFESIYYFPDVYVFHLVNPKKLSLLYSIRASFNAGRNFYNMRNNKNTLNSRMQVIIEIMRTVIGMFRDLIISIVHRNKDEFPYVRGYVHRRTLKYVRSLGGLYEQYKNK